MIFIQHRWMRDGVRNGWVCVESQNGWEYIGACKGCGLFIPDTKIIELNWDDFKLAPHRVLNAIANKADA